MSAAAKTVVVCNIEPGGRRRRMTSGLVIALLSALAAVYLHQIHAPWPARAALLLPWFGAATGVLQALHGTCIALAAAGRREAGAGHARDMDAERSAASRARAVRIAAEAVGVAALLTALGVVWR